ATTLCNDRVYLARSHTVSDHSILAATSYSSHPSMTTLSALGARAGVILLGAGAIEPQAKKSPQANVDFSLRGHPETWNDLNGNFTFDAPAEARKAYALAASVTLKQGKEEARAVVVGDSDVLTDVVLENPGNNYFALDTLKWLIGDEGSAGTV